jgi:hypothetical protein
MTTWQSRIADLGQKKRVIGHLLSVPCGTIIAKRAHAMPIQVTNSRGFSRTELVMALTLFAFCAVGVSVVARPSLAKSAEQSTEQLAPLLAAVSEWRTEHPNSCPTIGLLMADGYLDPSVPRDDPWGSVYRIQCEHEKLFVFSDGKDGRPNTPDDFRIEAP